MPKRRDYREKYLYKARHETRALSEFAEREREWAEDLILWYRIRNEIISDDEYRAAQFFINREYLDKPQSLTALYMTEQKLWRELPKPTKETAFFLVAYQYKVYCEVLKSGGWI